jgi:hypothetical protein
MSNLRTNRIIKLDNFDFVRHKGYYRRGSMKGVNSERWLHRYVWSKHHNKEIPDGFQIHHIDENPSNNDISNLELIKHETHAKITAKLKKNKTDNSYLSEKIKLRVDSILSQTKTKIKVLEAFAGDGLIWNEVKKQLIDCEIEILRIDMKLDKPGIYLKGNNLKFLPIIDLSEFDIIDLDAYGSPYKQLKILFEKEYKGIVHCTFIQTGMGNLDHKLLIEIGYTRAMIKKCQTLFTKNGQEKFEAYLFNHNIKEIQGFFFERKRYFWFKNLVN